MRRLRRFLALPPRDRRIRARASATVWAVRLCLWVAPFSWVRRLIARLARRVREAAPATAGDDEQIAHAVRFAAARVPGASCLTQALAARAMLGRAGLPGELRIGVRRDDGSFLNAHAWIERPDGAVLIGDHDVATFTVLPPLPGETG